MVALALATALVPDPRAELRTTVRARVDSAGKTAGAAPPARKRGARQHQGGYRLNPTYSPSAQSSRTAPLRITRRQRNVIVERELDVQIHGEWCERIGAELVRRGALIRVLARANARLLEDLPLYHGVEA